MESALGWLGDFFRFFYRLLPHFITVRQTHGGVAFVLGKARQLKRRWYIYLPLITEVEIYPVCLQSINLINQTLMTKDLKALVVGGILEFSIENLLVALTEVYDIDQFVQNVAITAIRFEIVGKTLDELQENQGSVDRQLTRTIRRRLKKYGVHVHRVRLSDFAPAHVHRIWSGGDGNFIPVPSNPPDLLG